MQISCRFNVQFSWVFIYLKCSRQDSEEIAATLIETGAQLSALPSPVQYIPEDRGR